MSAEVFAPIRPHRPARRIRKSAGERLRDAVQKLAAGHAVFAQHDEAAWASITFSGTRHNLHIVFEGPEAVCAGESFIAELPDFEFSIPGQLVADAAIASVEHTLLPAPRMTVTAVLLLLEES